MSAAMPESVVEAATDAKERGLPPFRVPRLAASLVTRERLVQRLDRLAAVTVLHAMSGFGKTALVGAWARGQQSRGATVLWVTATATGDSENVLDAVLQEAKAHRTARARLIVVIDDAHHLTHAQAIDDLCALLDHDFMLHVVVISRVRHPLIAAAEGRRIEIDVLSAGDLAADPLELVELARAWGHPLSVDEARQLHGLVGGWLTPAKLALDSRRTGDAVSLSERARRFIRAVVLPDVDEAAFPVQLGLLSLPETITAARADLLLGLKVTVHKRAPLMTPTPTPTREMLDGLERAGLLEPMRSKGERRWAFPAPIRGELVDSYEAQYPREAKEAHRQLAVHFAEQGEAQSLGEALLHARRGEDWTFLAHLYAKHALRLTFEFRAAAIGAYGHIPTKVVDAFPSLVIPVAVVSSLMNHPDEEERSVLIRAYATAGQRRLNQLSSTTSVDDALGAASAGMVSLRSDGLLREALEVALRVESERITRRTLGEPEPSAAQLAWFLMQWSMTCLLAGQTTRATEISARAFSASARVETNFVAANASAQLALIHALDGEPIKAERWLVQHSRFDMADQWVAHLVALPARIARIHRALDRLDEDGAAEALLLAGDPEQPIEMWAFLASAMVEHALLFGEPMGALATLKSLAASHPEVLRADSAARRIVDRCTADLLLALGELHRAQRHLAEVETDGPWLAVPRARLQLIAGNAAGAHSLAGAGAWRTGTTPRDRIDLLLIAATADLALGHPEDAVKAFAHAHELAEKANTLAPHARMPAGIRDLLLQLSGITLRPEEEALLATIRGGYPESGELIALTSREEVVLGQMLLHDTIPVIAEALTLSVNTIKKQTVSIYGKLGVSDRASALARAQRLGLLEQQQ